MATPILSVISPEYLIGAGIALIALEAVLFSFIVFWFGIASVIVGIVSYVITFSDGIHQVTAVSVLAVVMLIGLRSKALERFMKAKGKEHNDDYLNIEGQGVVRDSKVYYKATYWNIDSAESFEEGEKVNVLSVKNSTAVISKIKTTDN